jgi:thiol:disulfide interchange protein DsbA
MKRREFNLLAAATLAAPTFGTAWAQGAPVEGRQYLRLDPPVPVQAPAGKIDVVEFFSYACPHCNDFEPLLEQWLKHLPPDVHFHRIPVSFLFNAENFQKLYYTMETLNLVDQLQQKVFDSVHKEGQRLLTPADIQAFVQRNGVDGAKFMAVFNSFSIPGKVRQAGQQMQAYKVDSIPTIAVQGRFKTGPSEAGGLEQILQVTNALIAQARGH